ncbi:neutrophil gelatinase-associated lipocalin [Peromyscus leucopus]|uniref:neutrophil gelatinase-associated lipocalin n=1 Tax=Peromyscus leucopus TaxID=10041 RepID=UPI0010A19530|nr:neutrophil gelatinase-associated lipocalin [Peromyscus leucopus]XP_028740641.1 neutrophil gelatinase-associated lipocalin [Peromyscus leucopus]XP_037060461.1 neutrophil gelatinase-associated lipocalin [Peromyscus leucopus]
MPAGLQSSAKVPPVPSPVALPVTQPCATLTWGRKGQKSCQVFQQDMLAITSHFLDLVKDGPPHNTGAGSQVAHKESPWGVLLILFLLLLPTGPSPVTAETMALGVLCLALTLLGVLQSQAQDSTENLIPAPSLLKVPLQPGFQKDQFQGRWYVVGLAGNAVRKEEEGRFTMYSTTYDLQEDNSYNVTSILLRDQRCDYWIRTFVPSSRAGRFTLGNIRSYPKLRSYSVQVAATDYDQFAMVFFKKISGKKQYFKTTLYGRTKELPAELKERFVRFAKSLGLTDDHIIFSVPTDQCIDN